LAPKYEELAKLYADNPDFASKVTIAKVDATANDVPQSIQGFPTIKLFPAGSKDSPIEYSGSRTIEDLAEFIKEQGTHKIEVVVEAEEPKEDADEAPTSSSSSSSSTSSEKPAETDAQPSVKHDEL
jgi:protein disulfide-isomerase A1